MFERYRAMFALRNRAGDQLAAILQVALRHSKSALLKHEICYVMGQLQDASAETLAALHAILSDGEQHAMVRHEAAEAIGSIAGPEGRLVLESYSKDKDSVVAEGCEVALDILEYEQSGAFEYCAL